MSEDTKSSAEIERDVEASRARLQGTLGDIRERMSVGQMVDEVFAYAKQSGGGEITRNLGRAVRENPLPLLLVGAGIGWMMLDSGGGARDRREWHARRGEDYGQGDWAGWENGHRGAPPQPAGGGGPGLAGRVAAGVGQVGEAVGNAASAAYDGASDAYHGVAGAVQGVAGAVEGAGAYAGRTAERAAHLAGDIGGRVAHGASDLAGGVREEAGHAGRLALAGWRSLAEQQPLVLAAIGVALGAAVGAVIPSTGIENRAMGERAEAIKRTVGDAASGQIGKAKELVEEAYDDVTAQLDRQHLTDAAVGAVGAVADRVREAVEPEASAQPGASSQDAARPA